MASLLKGTGSRFMVRPNRWLERRIGWLSPRLLQPCQEEWARVECRQNRLRNCYLAVVTKSYGVDHLVADFAPVREAASRPRLRKCPER